MIISNGGLIMNQPSDEALRKMIRFLLKTSVPRINSMKAATVDSNEIKPLEVSQ